VVAADLPAIYSASCPKLAGLTAADFSQIGWKDWEELVGNCHDISSGLDNTLQINSGISDSSIAYSSTFPTDPAQLLWKSKGDIPQTILRYTLLDKQAQGQRLFFLAGVAAGLAGAFLPLGVVPFVTLLIAPKRDDPPPPTRTNNAKKFRPQPPRSSSIRARAAASRSVKLWPGGRRPEDPERDLFGSHLQASPGDLPPSTRFAIYIADRRLNRARVVRNSRRADAPPPGEMLASGPTCARIWHSRLHAPAARCTPPHKTRQAPDCMCAGQGLVPLVWQVLGSNQRRLSRRF
jgi:hypothetical protein